MSVSSQKCKVAQGLLVPQIWALTLPFSFLQREQKQSYGWSLLCCIFSASAELWLDGPPHSLPALSPLLNPTSPWTISFNRQLLVVQLACPQGPSKRLVIACPYCLFSNIYIFASLSKVSLLYLGGLVSGPLFYLSVSLILSLLISLLCLCSVISNHVDDTPSIALWSRSLFTYLGSLVSLRCSPGASMEMLGFFSISLKNNTDI